MCWKMSFPSANVGYAAVLTFGNTPSTFIKTMDGGAKFAPIAPIAADFFAILATQVCQIGGDFRQFLWCDLTEILNLLAFIDHSEGATDLVEQEGEGIKNGLIASAGHAIDRD